MPTTAAPSCDTVCAWAACSAVAIIAAARQRPSTAPRFEVGDRIGECALRLRLKRAVMFRSLRFFLLLVAVLVVSGSSPAACIRVKARSRRRTLAAKIVRLFDGPGLA